MENLLRPIYQERASHKDTLGILVIEKTQPLSPLTDNFDVVLLVITKNNETYWFVKHYEFEGKKAALHIVSEEKLQDWLMSGSNRRIISWIVNGKVIFDRNEYVANLKETIRYFPEEERKKKIGIEYAKLIRRFTDGRVLYNSKQFLDAYNFILHALHHMARLSVIEHGFHPEITVWSQVKHIEPEIFKLYNELLNSEEPLEKRLELLLIANDFSLSSKSKLGGAHLRQVMTKKETWSYQELLEEPELKDYGVDLGALLEHLIDKGLINIEIKETKGEGIFSRLYKV
ncbi:nucleotidyltransferase-like protein [Pseudalkalibacillus caeni]|uniref:Nucleotidyltransferase-like domain-containing protein n=1 Tax=Exobacillus caeni TaxID=2574798 RepID=A0A5R9F7D7_9BACL|nr:nucleotidyltransferase-like protein [Pseudalkalibacillus caeni]TLS35685.1 hypothetical protein FCL54_18685 [Pseudalkalibacillus caeni]